MRTDQTRQLRRVVLDLMLSSFVLRLYAGDTPESKNGKTKDLLDLADRIEGLANEVTTVTDTRLQMEGLPAIWDIFSRE